MILFEAADGAQPEKRQLRGKLRIKSSILFRIRIIKEETSSFFIAEPEKALCDKLYIVSPVTSLRAMDTLFFSDLRIDRNIFLQLNEGFNLSPYIPALKKELAAFGLHVGITEKLKSVDSKVQSAFLKANTKEQLLIFYGDQSLPGIHTGERIRIKFAVDTNPPPHANFKHQFCCKTMG